MSNAEMVFYEYCFMIYLWQGGKQKGDNRNGNYSTE